MEGICGAGEEKRCGEWRFASLTCQRGGGMGRQTSVWRASATWTTSLTCSRCNVDDEHLEALIDVADTKNRFRIRSRSGSLGRPCSLILAELRPVLCTNNPSTVGSPVPASPAVMVGECCCGSPPISMSSPAIAASRSSKRAQG